MKKDFNAVLDKMLADKEAAEAKEAKNAKPISSSEAEMERAFLMRWLQKGKVTMNNVGGNFWIPGSNRQRGSIYKPVRLVQLVKAGVLEKISERSYKLILAAPAKKCLCRAPKRSIDCAYCGTRALDSHERICGVCKEAGIDGEVIRGTNRVVCKEHKK